MYFDFITKYFVPTSYFVNFNCFIIDLALRYYFELRALMVEENFRFGCLMDQSGFKAEMAGNQHSKFCFRIDLIKTDLKLVSSMADLPKDLHFGSIPTISLMKIEN